MNVNLVVAALLHHVFDRQNSTLEVSPSDLKEHFGPDVVAIAEETSRLSYARQASQKTGSYEELARLLGNIKDVRVTIVKLASGLEMARTLQPAGNLGSDNALAQFLLNSYATLAGRLGMWVVKQEIENCCFATLKPDLYKAIRQAQSELFDNKCDIIDKIQQELNAKCRSLNITAQVLRVTRGEYGRYRDLRSRQLLYSTQNENRNIAGDMIN